METICIFENVPLPYPYEALEPFIDIRTMYIHHDKHLGTYVDKLNALIANHPALAALVEGRECCGFLELAHILASLGQLPEDIRTPVKNNAGGVYNHWFYFNGLTAHPQKEPQGALGAALVQDFGSLDEWKKQMAQAALGVFGSGYAWLVSDADGKLSLAKTHNQDTPMEQGLTPLLCVDVWEHAYYLKHQNRRAEYIQDWMEVINWDWAERCYEQVLSS